MKRRDTRPFIMQSLSTAQQASLELASVNKSSKDSVTNAPQPKLPQARLKEAIITKVISTVKKDILLK